MRFLLPYLFLFLPNAGAFGQAERLPDQLRAWEAAGQSDSVDFYYPKLADAYQTKDQLADFLYAYWDWQAFWFDDDQKALAILDTALARQWRAPAGTEEGEALLWVQINRGYHLGEMGKILPSTEAYEAALRLYERFGFDFFDAVDYLFLPLGAHYTRLGDNEKARGIYLQAIPIAETHQDAESLAGLYNNLGLTYWNAGQYAQAVETYRRGLGLKGLSPLRTGLLNLSLAQSFFDRGEYEKTEERLALAEKHLLQEEAAEAQLDYLSGVRKLQGDLCVQQEKYERANRYFAESLRLAQQVYGEKASRDIGKIHVSRGQLYLRQHKFEEALSAFNQAISSVLPAFQPANEEENPSRDQLYEENTLLEALAGKGETYRQNYITDQNSRFLLMALSCFELAYEVETRLRTSFQYESSKLTLLADGRKRTEKALEILLELYRDDPGEAVAYQALEWMERARAVVLLDALQDNLARNAIQAGDTLLQWEQETRRRAAFFERQLILQPESERRAEWQREKFQLERRLDEIAGRLAEKYPRLQDFRDQEKSFDRNRFRRVLLPGPASAYISYFAGEDHLYGVMISATGAAKFTRLGSAGSLREQAILFLRSFAGGQDTLGIERYEQLARKLSDDLLAPLLPDDPAAAPGRLCIAPEAWLGYLPFEALVYPGPGKVENAASWSKVDFLLRHCQVHYVFSAAVAFLQAQMNQGAGRTARLTAPLFAEGERRLAPLPGSREELAAIAPRCSERLLGAEAVRDRVLDRIYDFRLLHFSTHARADSAGRGARIELYDQSLYLPDIYALRLQARLVVLSACESGIGRVEKGEGVMSLARAFTYAGANGLVSSLWSVNARTTTDLMQGFYGGLRTKRRAVAALHQAKLDYLDSESVSGLYKSPYYWAGFIYVGPPAVDMQFPSSFLCRPGTAIAAGSLLLLFAVWFLWRRRRVAKSREDKKINDRKLFL